MDTDATPASVGCDAYEAESTVSIYRSFRLTCTRILTDHELEKRFLTMEGVTGEHQRYR